MIKRIAALSLIVMAAVLAAYTAMWFYVSAMLTHKISYAAEDVARRVLRSGGEFYYSYSEIKGFPFGFDITFHEVRFSHADYPIQKLTTEGAVIVHVPIFSDQMTVTLPQHLNLAVASGETHDNWSVTYPKAPTITFLMNHRFFTPLSVTDLDGYVLAVISSLKEIQYLDEGFILGYGESQIPLARSSSNFFGVELESMETTSDVNTGLVWESRQLQIVNEDEGLAPFDISLDAEFSGKEDDDAVLGTSITVRKLSVASEDSAMNIDGYVDTNATEDFPFGELYIEIMNYDLLMEHYVASHNYLVGTIERDDWGISTATAQAFKRLLIDVADRHIASRKTLQLAVTRKEGYTAYIGRYDLKSLWKLY